MSEIATVFKPLRSRSVVIRSIDKLTSRSKKVLRICREHYLRDDISSGSPLIDKGIESDPAYTPRVLSATPYEKRYLMVDTNVLLHHMDLMEKGGSACDGLKDVIVCETVVSEVKHRDFGVYKRLMSMVKDVSNRRYFVFPNEHNRGSFDVQRDDESDNDYNDRLIRLAASWYRARLEGIDEADVLLVTNDRENRAKALAAGLSCMTLRQYVQELSAAFPDMNLTDYAGSYDEGKGHTRKKKRKHDDLSRRTTLYPKYWSDKRVKDVLQRPTAFKHVVKGTIRQNRYNRNEATVTTFDGGEERLVRLSSREAINRAIDGDVVLVEVLDGEEEEEEDKSPSGVASSKRSKATTPPVAKNSSSTTGRVVAVLKRNWRPYCGTLLKNDFGGGGLNKAIFCPKDRRIPRIRIKTRQRSTLEAKWIVVAIDAWDENSAYPDGHYVRTIGDVADRAVESEVILIEHAIPTEPFTPAVIKCLPPEDWAITPENMAPTRVDLRHLDVCSIDPPGCKDIDDALHARVLPDDSGLVEVGVHIADVSYYVRPETAIDEEAARRATTTYLVQRRLDMLPKLLTETLCSVRANVDRFVFSAIWIMNPETAKIVSVKFHRSIVHSRAAMTYGDAQAFLDDPQKTGKVADSVRLLHKIAQKLRQRRRDMGALNLASPEVRFQMDSETHDPVAVEMYRHKQTNALVEEFMLLANISVAKKIVDFFPSIAVLRRHPAPAPRRFEDLIRAADSVGVKINADTSKQLADSLDNAYVSGMKDSNKIFRILATRCMNQATYFCSGEFAESERHHYGLATPIYTHFTSPIRRYADVMVHRMLSVAIGIEPMPKTYQEKAAVRALCDNCNQRHYAAQMAGRASVQLYTRVFFRDKSRVLTATILSVRPTGVGVIVLDFGFEGFVRLNGTGEEGGGSNEWTFDSEKMALTNATKRRVLSMFQEIRVELKVLELEAYREEVVVTLVHDENDDGDDNSGAAP